MIVGICVTPARAGVLSPDYDRAKVGTWVVTSRNLGRARIQACELARAHATALFKGGAEAVRIEVYRENGTKVHYYFDCWVDSVDDLKIDNV